MFDWPRVSGYDARTIHLEGCHYYHRAKFTRDATVWELKNYDVCSECSRVELDYRRNRGSICYELEKMSPEDIGLEPYPG